MATAVPWAPGGDGRGYHLDAAGRAVWGEPGWTVVQPDRGPLMELRGLREIFDMIRRDGDSAVIDDPATPTRSWPCCAPPRCRPESCSGCSSPAPPTGRTIRSVTGC
jgi:hypothetical protein